VGEQVVEDPLRRTAEAVRAACLQAALDGYERAGLSGLCEEGRWEMALDAIQSLDVNALLRKLSDQASVLP
jgi:hypothetical protein